MSPLPLAVPPEQAQPSVHARIKLVFSIDLRTAEVRIRDLRRLPRQAQGRRLAAVASQLVSLLRLRRCPLRRSSALPRELTNDAVLAGRSLPALLNPCLPLAIVP